MLYFYVLLYCVIILLCYECICMCNMYRRVNFSQLYMGYGCGVYRNVYHQQNLTSAFI